MAGSSAEMYDVVVLMGRPVVANILMGRPVASNILVKRRYIGLNNWFTYSPFTVAWQVIDENCRRAGNVFHRCRINGVHGDQCRM